MAPYALTSHTSCFELSADTPVVPQRYSVSMHSPSRTAQQPQYLRVVFSPGVSPDKWFGRFDERVRGWRIAAAQADDPLVYISSGAADVALVRLGEQDTDTHHLHHVVLYAEQLGVAAPRDHPLRVMDSVDYAELEGETVVYMTPADGAVDMAALRQALEVVAANVGVVIAPRPLLRAINQRGVVHRDVLGAQEYAGSTRVGVVWLKSRDSAEVQDFVGVCRGRTVGSSRQLVRPIKRGSYGL